MVIGPVKKGFMFYVTYADTAKSKNYDKCSKISSIFLFLISIKMLFIRAGTHKMHVRIANREDPDQTASSEAV